MTRKQADAAFESLRRHASAITTPSAPAEALKLLDRAVLSQLQRDAMVHYIAVGPDNLALAYSVLKAGAAAFATAGFASLDTADEPGAAEPSAERELFARRMIALDRSLEGAEPADRGTRLLDAFTCHVAAGRARFGAAPADPTATTPPADGSGDLLEAAGIAYVIAQLLESPPRPTPPAPTRP